MAEQTKTYCSCLYYSANALARVMTKMAEEEFAITGLAPSYALLLMGVNKKPGIQPKELSEMLQLTPSTVTRLIEKLEYKGIVKRQTVGRATEVYPTKKSRELNQQIEKAWENLHIRYTELLGEAHTQQLTNDIHLASQKLGQ